MITFPNAKINLGLNVVSKRADGFHNIETVFYPINLVDILEVVKSNTFNFCQTGIPVGGNPDDNLCVKAYRILETEYNLKPVSIHLNKIIPMGAGLGGGSSDASFMLKAINILFELNLSNNKLKHYAAQIGSDCSFFIDNTPSKAHGRGELLESINVDAIKGPHILLVKPNVHVSTKDAYANIKPKTPTKSIQDILKTPVEEWKSGLKNDFETTIFAKYPEISNIKNTMYEMGAIYSSMSGSGASVFGLFNDKPNALIFNNMWHFCDIIKF